MLKILLAVGLAAVALFLLACVIVAGIMLVLAWTTPKEDAPPKRDRRSEVEPPADDELFRRLAAEAMAYASRPFHTTITDVTGFFLLVTVSDPFGRKVYAESRRRVSKTINAVICVYEDGNHVPVASAMTEIPSTRVEWSDHFVAIKDIQAAGPKLSFIDHLGRRREARIPKGGRHHA